MEEFPSGKEKDILHPHCKNCIKTSRCFMKPIPDESCEIINCAMKCGFRFHACKSEEHSLLCANEKVPCINAVYGCPFKLLRHQRAKHLETCPASVVVCTMEWNRWPLINRERQTSTSPRKVNPPVESQLDVALALRDQRMLNEWLKTSRNIESIQRNQTVPVVSVATGAEYLCIETDNTIVLHDGSDEEYEELPEGGRYAFYFVAGDSSCELNSNTESSSFSYNAEYNGETNILEQGGKLDDTEIIDVCNALFKEAQKDGGICEDREISGKICTDAEVNKDVSEKPQTGKHVCEETRAVGMMCEEETNKVENHAKTVEVDNSNYKLILHYESFPMVTEPWSTGNEYNMLPCDMELDEPSTNNSIQFLDNHHVSDIFSASVDDHVSSADAPVHVECSPSSVPLDLDLTVEYLNRCRSKPRNIYTFVCAQEFRRDQYSMHYKNVHSDIHGGLNGWLEYRCPLAPHGCTYSMTRLYPSFKGARVVHSVVLESFGVKMCAQDDNSNMKLSYVSETLKNGILECLEECEMDIEANGLSKEKRGLCQLPCEVLRHIFGFLDPFSLCNVALICHSFRAICATLLGERGIVVQRWHKEKNNWNIIHKTWMFSTSFTPVLTWGFEENGHMANHMKVCPYFERNICTKPFFHLLNEEPSPELRAKLETKVEGDIW